MAPLLYAKVALWTAFLGFMSELAGCVCERMLPAACTYCVAPARTCCSVSHRCLPPTITRIDAYPPSSAIVLLPHQSPQRCLFRPCV